MIAEVMALTWPNRAKIVELPTWMRRIIVRQNNLVYFPAELGGPVRAVLECARLDCIAAHTHLGNSYLPEEWMWAECPRSKIYIHLPRSRQRGKGGRSGQPWRHAGRLRLAGVGPRTAMDSGQRAAQRALGGARSRLAGPLYYRGIQEPAARS